MLGIQAALGLQLGLPIGWRVGFTQEDARLLQRPRLHTIKACICHHGAHGQCLLVPRPGPRVVQIGMQLPAGAIGPGLQRAAQIRVWSVGHEQCRIHMAQIGLRLLYRLRQPRAKDGADIGGQAVVRWVGRARRVSRISSMWGMGLGLDGELGRFGGQRAADVGTGGDGESLRRLVGQGRFDRALQLGFQLHGGGGLQLGLGFIQAAGIVQAADLQLMVAAGVAVLPIQRGHGGLWWPLPD